MSGRVTQDYVEALIVNRNPAARLTQDYMEVLVAQFVPPENKARVTQHYIEVLVTAESPAEGRVYGPALQMMG